MEATDLAQRLAALSSPAAGGSGDKPQLPRIIKAGMVVRNAGVSEEKKPLEPPAPVYPEGYVPPEEAHRQAQEILAAANQQAEQIREEARRQAQEAGYQAGLEAGRQESLQAWAGLIAELRAQLEGLLAQRQEMLAAAEPDIVRLVLLAASKVVQREARHPDLAAHLVSRTLPRASEGTLVRVRVSPADFERLAADQPIAPGMARYELVADPGVGQGGCIVDTALCSIDATFRLLFEEVCRELMQDDPKNDALIAAEVAELAQPVDRDPVAPRAEGPVTEDGA